MGELIWQRHGVVVAFHVALCGHMAQEDGCLMSIRFAIHISAFDGGRDHETAQTRAIALLWTNGLDVVRAWGDSETGSLDPSYLGC